MQDLANLIRFCIDNDIEVQGLASLLGKDDVIQFGEDKKKSSKSPGKKTNLNGKSTKQKYNWRPYQYYIIYAIISIAIGASIAYSLRNNEVTRNLFRFLPGVVNVIVFGIILALLTFTVFKILNEFIWYWVERTDKGDVMDCKNDPKYGCEILCKYSPSDKSQKICWIKGSESTESPSKERRYERVYDHNNINQCFALRCTPAGLTYYSENSTLWLLPDDPNDVTRKAILGTYNADYTKMTYKRVMFNKETKEIIALPEGLLNNIKAIFCCNKDKVSSLAE